MDAGFALRLIRIRPDHQRGPWDVCTCLRARALLPGLGITSLHPSLDLIPIPQVGAILSYSSYGPIGRRRKWRPRDTVTCHPVPPPPSPSQRAAEPGRGPVSPDAQSCAWSVAQSHPHCLLGVSHAEGGRGRESPL